MNKEEKRKLKNLNRGVWPETKWLEKSGERVVMFAKSAEPVYIQNGFPARRIAIGFFSFVIFVGSFGVATANQSLPGERFYPVKKIIEKGEVAIAESVGGDKIVQQKILKRRVEELEKVVQLEPEDTAKQEMAVKAVEEAVAQTIEKNEKVEAASKANENVIIEKVKTVKDKIVSEEVVRNLEIVERKINISATGSGRVKGESLPEENNGEVAKPEKPGVPDSAIDAAKEPEKPQGKENIATESGVTNP